MATNVCFRCGSSEIEEGVLENKGTTNFHLKNVPFFTLTTSSIEVRGTLCLNCGAISLTGDIDQARRILKK